MKKYLSLVVVLSILLIGGLGRLATEGQAADASEQAIANQIIAREKASTEAWQRKDKAFWSDYMSDDATYFGAQSPYLETDPKANFITKFDQYVEIFKINDFQMYNPRVQVYGDVAILTYNSSVMASMAGQPMSYTGKVTSIYVKQGNAWRVVHGHESMNPGQK